MVSVSAAVGFNRTNANDQESHLPFNDLQYPNVDREEQDAQEGGADQGMVSVDEDRDVKYIHDVLVHRLC